MQAKEIKDLIKSGGGTVICCQTTDGKWQVEVFSLSGKYEPLKSARGRCRTFTTLNALARCAKYELGVQSVFLDLTTFTTED